MKIFGRNRIKPYWSFSQNGNIWRFIFGGKKYIIGETRDTEGKKMSLFTLDYTSGKQLLKNFSFENNNYWVSLEGSSEKMFFMGRFEKPELPYQIHIIAIDTETGNKLWENEEYSYLFNTEKIVYGIKKEFESSRIAEIDMDTGKPIRVLNTDEHLTVFNLRNENEDFIFENSNYPVLYEKEKPSGKLGDVFNKICYDNNDIGTIEYIQKGSLLIFNYYVKFATKENEQVKSYFENRFVVYNIDTDEFLLKDVLNKITNYCVPDNFFIRNEYLFYLKEKIGLHCIKLD